MMRARRIEEENRQMEELLAREMEDAYEVQQMEVEVESSNEINPDNTELRFKNK